MTLNLIDDLKKDEEIEELKKYRSTITRKIENKKRSKKIKIETYLSQDLKTNFEIAKTWAFENGLTQKNSKWSFAKFCILNTMKLILEEIERQNTPDEATAIEYETKQLSDGYQEEPNIQTSEIAE